MNVTCELVLVNLSNSLNLLVSEEDFDGEPNFLNHCLEEMIILLLVRISEGDSSCWDTQESETGCRGLFFHETSCSFCFLSMIIHHRLMILVLSGFSGYSTLQLSSKVYSLQVLHQSIMFHPFLGSSYCHCIASATRQSAHNMQQTVK